jgi:molybdate transport system substrate-binding protein
VKLRVAVLLSVLALIAACQSPEATRPGPSPAAPTTNPSNSPAPSIEAANLTVYGAASLQGALEQVKATYEADHPGTTLTISTDSSATLRTQIEQGAPADVFLSADITNPAKLIDGGLADGDQVAFAGNLLTIVVPTANPAKIATPADLAKRGIKVIAAGDEVPITKYANQAIGLLADLPGYPADFAAAYARNIVSKEDNVTALIAKIELGEGDAGIVYVTDAKASTKVEDVAIPPEASVSATYAGVVVKASKNVAAARAFLDWIAGADGQKILASFGFIPPQT